MQSARPVGGQGKPGGWAWLWVSVLVAACGGDAGRGVDEKCFEEGRCACRDNADCSDGVCVDGQCRAVIDTSVEDTFFSRIHCASFVVDMNRTSSLVSVEMR